ncbi:MAG: cytochrome c nitrite reductase small subunit [Candidatus Cyclonatronum sp.]|uniref:cytochrome c nitrite reductase small subunit n=1 Tax=Cyclonatronum sp. TaxID=3024185 RepID=UPI0025BBD328|nr:cytochrome c nitrite reductase small subunit [Cyclonatronum sp.]MCC5935309.1 cytochrome c nitrite reductase small subunit [Balneolales bacterium]MCH8487421.1 cytochrome c nitrite reductase small subunit [Cyclonatronum sp.]
MTRITTIIRYLLPPPNWRIPVIVLMGALFGIGGYAFIVSNAVSYLSDDPATCVNCHVMGPQYATWFHSSHREHANCNDCHVPQDNLIKQYYFKAQDGLRHATIFTLNTTPDPIVMHEAGQRVVQANCQRCHDHTNQFVTSGHVTYDHVQEGRGQLCWDCHRDVPHGTVRGAASIPNARVPVPQSPMPDWLRQQQNR